MDKAKLLIRIGAAALCLAWAPHAGAGPMADQFQALLKDAINGPSEVTPLTAPVDLKYRPVSQASKNMRFYTMINDPNNANKPAHLSLSTTITFDRSLDENGTLRTVSEIHPAIVSIEGQADHALKNKFPDGTKVVALNDDGGALIDVWLEPPQGSDAATLPAPGSKEFMKIVGQAIPGEFSTRRASQGDEVYPSVLLGNGPQPDNVTLGGHKPKLMGRVPCGTATCLYVRIKETTLTEINEPERVKVQTAVKGYMLLDERTLRTKKSLIWMNNTLTANGVQTGMDTIQMTTTTYE